MAQSKKSQKMMDEVDWIQKYVQQCRHQSEEARRDRLLQNSRNRDAYLNRQDWSHKQEGQSMEFLPKTSSAVELHTGFIKSGLMQFGEWFDVDVRDLQIEQALPPKTLQKMMEFYLAHVWVGGNERTRPFGLLFSDAVKMGLLESLIILKVGGASG